MSIVLISLEALGRQKKVNNFCQCVLCAVPCRAVWYFNRMKIIIIKTNTLLQTKNSDALQHLKDNPLSANDIISNYFLTVKFYLQLNCYIFSNSFNY